MLAMSTYYAALWSLLKSYLVPLYWTWVQSTTRQYALIRLLSNGRTRDVDDGLPHTDKAEYPPPHMFWIIIRRCSASRSEVQITFG